MIEAAQDHLHLLENARNAGQGRRAYRGLAANRNLIHSMLETGADAWRELYVRNLYLSGIVLNDLAPIRYNKQCVAYFSEGIAEARGLSIASLWQAGQFHLGNALRIGKRNSSCDVIEAGFLDMASDARGHLLLARASADDKDEERFRREISLAAASLDSGTPDPHVNESSVLEVRLRGLTELECYDEAMSLLEGHLEGSTYATEPWRAILAISAAKLKLQTGPAWQAAHAVQRAASLGKKAGLPRQVARLHKACKTTGLDWHDLTGSDQMSLTSKLKQCRRSLKYLAPGPVSAGAFQEIVTSIINLTLCPPLSVPEQQVTNRISSIRIDAAAANCAITGLLAQLISTSAARVVLIEAKNKVKLAESDFSQLSGYFDRFKGRFGLLVKRREVSNQEFTIAARRLWGKREIILPIADGELDQLIEHRLRADDPSKVLAQVLGKVIARV